MLSRFAYIFSVVLMCYASFFFYPRWNKWTSEATISWDVSGYYWYLPSIFVYHDLKGQSFKDSVMAKYHPTNDDFQQGMKLDNGNYVMKYASGMAVMYFPFFITAHLLARPLGFPADGFSPPYQLAIQLGGFLISILGLWYLRKLLLNFYSDKVVAIVLLLLVVGTNYLNYAAIDNGMSHCWLFTVYVFLLLNTYYFYQSFKLKNAIWIGLLVGLATLTRPTDIISCLIPLLWGLEKFSIPAFKNQFDLFKKHAKPLIIAAICAGCVISIQLIYWKYVTGEWFYYSYGGQGFSFQHPHPFLYTLSYRSGWLRYTPVMLLAFAGIIPFLDSGKNKRAILTFFLLNYYIVCSWDIYWYGGRAMVQSYPILLFPVASLVDWVLNRKYFIYIFTPIVVLFTYLNIWITWQYHRGKLYDADCMTEAYYKRVAGRWSAPDKTLVLRDVTELYEGDTKDLKPVYQNDFEKDTGVFYRPHGIGGKTVLELNKYIQLSPEYQFDFDGHGAKWLRVQARIRINAKEWDVWRMAQFVVQLLNKGNDGKYRVMKENMIRVQRLLIDNQTREISVDVKLPAEHFDAVRIRFWNGDSDKELFVDHLQAWQFNE